MNKECIFLSDDNYCMLYNLRKASLTKGIEIVPCRNIFDMLSKFHDGVNAVLVELTEKFEGIKKYISNEHTNKIFYIKDDKIYDLNKSIVYESINEFLSSNLFYSIVYKFNSEKCLQRINDRFNKLGAVVNSTYSLYIKTLIFEMKKLCIPKITKQLMEDIATSNCINCNNLCDLIRPTVKEYAKLLEQKNFNLKSTRVKDVINDLYKYCLEC